jgi:hypothetical protein
MALLAAGKTRGGAADGDRQDPAENDGEGL